MNDYSIFSDSMNGIITLTDGHLNIENGIIQNAKHINASIGTFNNLSSIEITNHDISINDNLILITDNTSNIINNTNLIDVNIIDISDNKQNISNNKLDISSNTDRIIVLEQSNLDISNELITIHSDISDNRHDININKGDIALNILAIQSNASNILFNSSKIDNNYLDISDIQQNPIFDGILPDINTGNINQSNKSIVQTGTTNNQLQTTTIADLNVLNSITLPSDITIDAATHNNVVQYNDTGYIIQTINNNTPANQFRDTTFTNLTVSGSIDQTNPAKSINFAGDLFCNNDIHIAPSKSIWFDENNDNSGNRFRIHQVSNLAVIDFHSEFRIRTGNTAVYNIMVLKDNLINIHTDLDITGNITSPTITTINNNISTNASNISTNASNISSIDTRLITVENKSVIKDNELTAPKIFNNLVCRPKTGIGYGFYIDFHGPNSTNDFDIRLQTQNYTVANGQGVLSLYGNLSIDQNLNVNSITSPTITTIENDINDLSDSVLTNAIAISNNTTAISNNTTAINNNTNDISTNSSNIYTNSDNIAANTVAISNNSTNISTNSSNITDLQTTKANINGPRFDRYINFKSGDSYGFYIDFNTNTSTVDYNVRFMLSESYNPTVTGGGMLDYWGNYNFRNGSIFFDGDIEIKKSNNKLYISHELDNPSITYLQNQINDLSTDSDGHTNNTIFLQSQIDTLDTSVNSLQTQVDNNASSISNNTSNISSLQNQANNNSSNITDLQNDKAPKLNPVFTSFTSGVNNTTNYTNSRFYNDVDILNDSSLYFDDIEIKKTGQSLFIGAEIDSESIHEIHDNNGLKFYKNDYTISNNAKVQLASQTATTIAHVNISKTHKGKIKINTPVSLLITYQNFNQDANLFNRFEATIDNIQYFIYRNGILFDTGDCSSNETLASIHTQVASNVLPLNQIEIFQSNFTLEFTPDTVPSTDNNNYVYDIKFKIFSTYDDSWQNYNLKVSTLSFYVNTGTSTFIPGGLNITSGGHGQDYSAFSDDLIPILPNPHSHNHGCAYISNIMSDQIYMNEKLVATQEYVQNYSTYWESNYIACYENQIKSFSFNVGTGYKFEDFTLEVYARTPSANAVPVAGERTYKLANSEETDRGISYNASYNAGWYHIDMKLGTSWIFRAYMFDTYYKIWPDVDNNILQQSGQYQAFSNAWIGVILRKH